MRGKTAGLILIMASVVLAALLLTDAIGPTVAGIGFAVALMVLGLASRDFRK